jgi:hypothetical protein
LPQLRQPRPARDRRPPLLPALTRIAEALERLAPPALPRPDLGAADAFVWHPAPVPRLAPVPKVSAVEIGLLQGVERQKAILLENTLRFARGLPANNAMLWGARGMGKSSLVKAAHAEASRLHPPPSPSSRSTARTSAPCRSCSTSCAASNAAPWCCATTCPSRKRMPTTRR